MLCKIFQKQATAWNRSKIFKQMCESEKIYETKTAKESGWDQLWSCRLQFICYCFVCSKQDVCFSFTSRCSTGAEFKKRKRLIILIHTYLLTRIWKVFVRPLTSKFARGGGRNSSKNDEEPKQCSSFEISNRQNSRSREVNSQQLIAFAMIDNWIKSRDANKRTWTKCVLQSTKSKYHQVLVGLRQDPACCSFKTSEICAQSCQDINHEWCPSYILKVRNSFASVYYQSALCETHINPTWTWVRI